MGGDGAARIGQAARDEGGRVRGHVVAVARVEDAARADVGGDLERGDGELVTCDHDGENRGG